MGLICIQPGWTPIDLADAKQHLRVDSNADDTLIEAYINGAASHIEQTRSLSLTTAIYELRLDAFPKTGVIRLPIVPTVSVSDISYYDADGNLQSLDDSLYIVGNLGNDHSMTVITAAVGTMFPQTQTRIESVVVTFMAGYATDEYGAAEIPPDLRAAILLYVGSLYENREAQGDRTITELPMGFEQLISVRGITRV